MGLMTKEQRNSFFSALSKAYPDPRCELVWTNHYSLLVAIILSAQSTDKNVNKVTSVLFPIADTPEKILALGEDKVRSYIKSINYFNNSSKVIRKTIKISTIISLIIVYIIITYNNNIFSTNTKDIFTLLSTVILIPLIYDSIKSNK